MLESITERLIPKVPKRVITSYQTTESRDFYGGLPMSIAMKKGIILNQSWNQKNLCHYPGLIGVADEKDAWFDHDLFNLMFYKSMIKSDTSLGVQYCLVRLTRELKLVFMMQALGMEWLNNMDVERSQL